MKDRYKVLFVMKRLYLFMFLCLIVCLASCNKKDDNSIFYTSDEIYLNCVEYSYVSSDFPKGLLIFESEEQLECALKEYEGIGSLAELETITEEYPVGEYIYLLNCMNTEYDSKVECKGLRIDETAMTIHLEHKIKSPKKESPAAIKYYITYAVLPKKYWNNYDFSKQQGVQYLGKEDIDLTDESGPVKENPENEGVDPPEILNLDSFEKIAELKSILFRCFVDTSEGVYVPDADAVCSLDIGDKTVAFYALEDEAAYAFVGRTETANSLITIMISEGDEEKMRNTIEGNIVCLTLNELIGGDASVK